MNHDPDRYTTYQTGCHAPREFEVKLTSTAELFGHRPFATCAATNRDAAIMLRRTMERADLSMADWFEIEYRYPWSAGNLGIADAMIR